MIVRYLYKGLIVDKRCMISSTKKFMLSTLKSSKNIKFNRLDYFYDKFYLNIL